KAAVGKVIGWAFATKTFKDAEGKDHSLYVSDAGVLTVASTPQSVTAFVDWFVAEKKADPEVVKRIRPLIAKAQGIVDKMDKKNPEADTANQKALLEVNTSISEELSKLVGKKDLGKVLEKYLLEGQVGTYATIPKPVGDQLTPDHQPQASVIQGAAKF